ncbi:MAG: hypothetical protein JST28_20665 [Acidobacteria bacterium]|nr:hypothetical protein [Acidobacteriota bacterium]
MPPITKEEFRAPAHMLEKELERLAIPKPKLPILLQPDLLVGTWVNVDPLTRDLVRLEIKQKGNEITVHGFGACHPNPCDWGVVDGRIYSDTVATMHAVAFTAEYRFDFAQVLVTGAMYKGALFVETLTRFTDQSGRADVYALDILNK